MVGRRVSDIWFGEIKVRYGRKAKYSWNVEHGTILHFESTRHLSNQRKLVDKFLEATGELLLKISNEAWIMLVNKALSNTETYSEDVLEEIWLKRVAQFVSERLTEDQADIGRGGVYETNTGYLFLETSLVNFLEQFDEMQLFLPEWHQEKLRALLKVKTSSVSLRDWKGRAAKINSYSAGVDRRFYEHLQQTDDLRASRHGKDHVHTF
jgi:hypothetical protein